MRGDPLTHIRIRPLETDLDDMYQAPMFHLLLQLYRGALACLADSILHDSLD